MTWEEGRPELVGGARPIPIVDVFVGPGGLGEGFSSLTNESGQRAFRLELSVEKEVIACQTLRLRAVRRRVAEAGELDAYTSMKYYGNIGQAINGTRGWDVSVETMRLPVPQDLVDTGWHTDDFERLSVAYGLSLASDCETTLGRIVSAIEVPDMKPYVPPARDDAFVSKDHV